ncbi:MAG: hypothetical protein ACRDB0_05110 [Paraclostridium sp.]
MRNILRKVRNENFKDLKRNDKFKDKCKIDGVASLGEIEDIEIQETSLYMYLEVLSIEQLKEINYYMLAGRELSRYYGTKQTVGINEYVEYFRGNSVAMDKIQLIEYICFKSKALNNYIDTALRFI